MPFACQTGRETRATTPPTWSPLKGSHHPHLLCQRLLVSPHSVAQVLLGILMAHRCITIRARNGAAQLTRYHTPLDVTRQFGSLPFATVCGPSVPQAFHPFYWTPITSPMILMPLCVFLGSRGRDSFQVEFEFRFGKMRGQERAATA